MEEDVSNYYKVKEINHLILFSDLNDSEIMFNELNQGKLCF